MVVLVADDFIDLVVVDIILTIIIIIVTSSPDSNNSIFRVLTTHAIVIHVLY